MFREYAAAAVCFVTAAALVLTSFCTSGILEKIPAVIAADEETESGASDSSSNKFPSADTSASGLTEGNINNNTDGNTSGIIGGDTDIDTGEYSGSLTLSDIFSGTGESGVTYDSINTLDGSGYAASNTPGNIMYDSRTLPPDETAHNGGSQASSVTTPHFTFTTSNTTTTTRAPVVTTTSKPPVTTKPAVTTTTTKDPPVTTTTTTTTTTTPPVTTTTTPTVTTSPEAATLYDQVFDLVNQIRAEHGLPPFKQLKAVDDAAYTRATEISSYYSHTRPDGRKSSSVLGDYGLFFHYAGENIAAGTSYGDPQKVVDAWMNSTAGHRENILSTKYEYMGVRYYYKIDDPQGYNFYWAQEFYTPFH